MSVLTATTPPEPISVEILSDGLPWWEVVGALAPLAVLLAAVLAAITAFASLRQRATADRAALGQRRRADDRAEWWRRTQWGIDAATSADPVRQEAGVKALLQLSSSELATEEDRLILDAIWARDPLADPVAVLDGPTTGSDTGGSTHQPKGMAMTDTARARPAPNGHPHDHRPADTVRVSAAKARLRVALDEQLGRETPQSVKDAATSTTKSKPTATSGK
ncbi:hypothetical protein FQ377_00965 [Arthrobacter echini]|uniref:Uncharacterized protein n=1 Tax=Arthrobacter echini TaxID=1529066 RepID=A0A5D0XVQ5_9MICC|nr:hypothetical protein [Arthrobacter echini]TYD00072.1 hypothetical protein FQ377_00965 [Arthrobacter echini]